MIWRPFPMRSSLALIGILALMVPIEAGDAFATSRVAPRLQSHLISEAQYNSLRQGDCRDPDKESYSFKNFIEGGGALFTNKIALAGFLAHAVHESALCVSNEIHPPKIYCKPLKKAPCAHGATYHGRGPLQITWNDNYHDFGNAVGRGADMLAHPETLTQNATLMWASAFFTYAKATDPVTNKTMLLALRDSPPQFGVTIRIINGPEECDGRAPSKVAKRVALFIQICELIGCPIDVSKLTTNSC